MRIHTAHRAAFQRLGEFLLVTVRTRRMAIPFCLSRSPSRFRSGREGLLRPADRPHFSTRSASTEEPVAAIGLEARQAHTGRHLEPLKNLARLRIDAPHVAFVSLPRAVPELAVNPCDAGHHAIGLEVRRMAPVSGSIFWMRPSAIWNRCCPSKAVPACVLCPG